MWQPITIRAVVSVIVIFILLIVTLIFVLNFQTQKNLGSQTKRIHEKTNILVGISEGNSWESDLGVYDKAAVSADGAPCAQIGSDILARNGTAADAAIATLFCIGVVNTHSAGLGGGFFLVLYQRNSGKAYALNAREVAPGEAHRDMFLKNGSSSTHGGLAVAVPGEIRGYREVYLRFGGGVSWSELIEPTLSLCENGFPVGYALANALKVNEMHILKEPSMSVFVDPSTGHVWKEGNIMFRRDLASTLRVLQTEPDALHNGSLTESFVRDIKELGGIISFDDLINYRVKWVEPVKIELRKDGLVGYSMPAPGSGVIYGLILNILKNYNFTSASLNKSHIVTTYQRIIEAFKYAFAQRTFLGDPDYVNISQLLNLTSDDFAHEIYSKIMDDMTFQDPKLYGAFTGTVDDHGTSHVSIVAPNGDAVSVTSTINFRFGAKIRSSSTGIVLNNEMDDFSTPNLVNGYGFPPSPANYIAPGKSPLSSMSPAIMVNEDTEEIRLVIGASGGSRIITGTALSSMYNLWFGKNIKEAIDSKRIHHQLIPMKLMYDKGFQRDIIDQLADIGHETEELSSYSVVCGISREDGKLYANSDARKRGQVDGF